MSTDIDLGFDIDFDPEALHQRYLAERDRRLRPEGVGQYVKMTGEFERYVDDPHVEPGFSRPPVTEEVDAVVVGGGFGGLLAAARLREAGITDVRIIEKGGDFGGVWYWNRYPGLQCDMESYIYLPLLEETGYIPREKYSYGTEIREHSRRIGKTFGLYEKALLQTEIKEMRWSKDDSRWIVGTDRDDRLMARYVVISCGPVNRPKLPGIPGMTDFRGHAFHTSRWDYDYTGGDASGNLTKLGDKRVAVVGTSQTAVQCIPQVARYAKHLYVFQRTPSAVAERNNKPTDPDWVNSLEPGWQQRRRENFNTLLTGAPQEEDLVNDGWTDITRKVLLNPKFKEVSREEASRLIELADYKKMNDLRARMDEIVEDPQTAEALKPWYRLMCKRPAFHDDYIGTFNRPNVTLIDTKGRGVERITETGLVSDGIEYEADCIIFATGFEVGTGYTRRTGFEIHGRDGEKLSEHWKDGLRTLHGFYSHGFPNLFHVGVTQNTLTPNYTHGLDEQASHVAKIIRYAFDHDAKEIEPTADAEAEWVQTIKDKARYDLKFYSECTPSYINGEGRPGEGKGLFEGLYGPGPIAFFNLLETWRMNGEMQGLKFQ